MITASDSVNTVDLGRYYAILPPTDSKIRKHYLSKEGVKEVAPGFCYASGNNTNFLSVTELRDLIRRHVSAEAL
jgi:hypothetical protein